MENQSLRTHIILGVIILILAVALLVTMMIPRQVHIMQPIQGPQQSGMIVSPLS